MERAGKKRQEGFGNAYVQMHIGTMYLKNLSPTGKDLKPSSKGCSAANVSLYERDDWPEHCLDFNFTEITFGHIW